MGAVLDFYKNQPHLAGEIKCMACNAVWYGVSVVGHVDGLQCPNCQTNRGIYSQPITVNEEQIAWHCNCNGQLFYLFPNGITMCCKCGNRSTDYFNNCMAPPPLHLI